MRAVMMLSAILLGGVSFTGGRGSLFGVLLGVLFIGALAQRRLVRLTLDNERVTGEEHLLVDKKSRIRDVRQGPDGNLYLVTDEDNGELLRVRPRS